MSTKESLEELRDEIRKLRDELREAGPRVTFIPQPYFIPYCPPPYNAPYTVPWYNRPTITWGGIPGSIPMGGNIQIFGNHAGAAAPQVTGYITNGTETTID